MVFIRFIIAVNKSEGGPDVNAAQPDVQAAARPCYFVRSSWIKYDIFHVKCSRRMSSQMLFFS